MRNIIFFRLKNTVLVIIVVVLQLPFANNTIREIGITNKSSKELALVPAGFKQLIARNFGYKDKFYLIGISTALKDFPYVLPGPVDIRGGTRVTSG